MSAQTSLFDIPPTQALSERELALVILDNMKAAYPGRIERYARLGRHLCHRNTGMKSYLIPHTVSSDDIRELGGIESDKRDITDFAPKSGTGNNWIPAIFKNAPDGKKFIYVTQKRSRIKGSHGRKINIYTIEEYAGVVDSYKKRFPELF